MMRKRKKTINPFARLLKEKVFNGKVIKDKRREESKTRCKEKIELDGSNDLHD